MALAAPDPVPATVILQQMIEVEVVSLLYGDGKGMDMEILTLDFSTKLNNSDGK